MVVAESVRRRLTPLSFRRDVRLFLALLVGFLIVVILVLLFVMLDFVQLTREAIRTNWETTADVVAAHIRGTSASAISGEIAAMKTRYGVADIDLTTRGGQTIVRSEIAPGDPAFAAVARTTPAGTLRVYFDRSPFDAARRRFLIVAGIAISATIAGAILLLLYVPRITRPIEEMLVTAEAVVPRDPAIEESDFVVASFRQSIAKLQEHEAELRRLHEIEKSRADDLERVTGALTRSLTSGLLALGPDGRIVEMNGVAREILPQRGELAGAAPRDAFGDNEFTALLERAFAERSALARVETRIDGRVVGVTTVPLVNDAGDLLGMLALFTDLTRIHTLEARLREMQALADLGEMSAGIAHEFRNSLSTILGYLTLSKRAAAPDDAARAIESARQEAAQLSAAVDGLLGFARPMQVDAQPLDLLALMRDVVERSGVGAEGVAVSCEGQPAVISGDARLLHRAMENLVRNAVESVTAKGGGEVRVRVEAAPQPRVIIADTGLGIDVAEVPRLFVPFQSDKAGGYGLGLPLARKIVLLHKGTLQLTGTPGEGATATVDFAA
jgi:signal transduction histidine kinase